MAYINAQMKKKIKQNINERAAQATDISAFTFTRFQLEIVA